MTTTLRRDIVGDIRRKAAALKKKIVLPEGEEKRTLKAAAILKKEGLCVPILIGNADKARAAAPRPRRPGRGRHRQPFRADRHRPAGDGTLVNSGPINGLPKAEAIAAITALLADQDQGRAAVNYRLRDWLLSRQRFWGTPIPIIHCPSCGEVPVPDDQLPVVLPDLRGQDLVPRGVSPLAAAEDWVNVGPRCGGPAKRDTDTMDTFVTRPGTCSATAR